MALLALPTFHKPLLPPFPSARIPAITSTSAARTRKLTVSLSSSSQAASHGNASDNDDSVSRAVLLWRAAKLPIYSVALVPLTVGGAAAFLQTGTFYAKRYLLLMAASVLVITWLNLSNDVYDFDTGADKNKKESVVNIVGSREVTEFAAITSLILGFMGIALVFAETGDIRFILLVTFAVFCGFVYQCPPLRLSYQGLGEPLCFAAFGPFATTAFYFSNSNKSLSSIVDALPLTPTVISASVLVGITTTLILFCSHFHQIEGDLAVHKMSPLVRMGTNAGSKVVKYGVMTLYILVLLFGILKALPVTCLFFSALTLPVGKLVVDFVERHHNDKIKIFMAKYYCVRLHAVFGAALAIGLFLARIISRQ